MRPVQEEKMDSFQEFHIKYLESSYSGAPAKP